MIQEKVDLHDHVLAAVAALQDHQPISTLGGAPPAWADAARVRQIPCTLLSNAIRYGGNEVRIELGVIGGRALVEMCDNGPGIEEGDHGLIFEACHRAHDRLGQPAGVGLSPAVSMGLAELMDGDLTYFRRDDWSVFSLGLPVAAANGLGQPLQPVKTSPGTRGRDTRKTWRPPAGDRSAILRLFRRPPG